MPEHVTQWSTGKRVALLGSTNLAEQNVKARTIATKDSKANTPSSTHACNLPFPLPKHWSSANSITQFPNAPQSTHAFSKPSKPFSKPTSTHKPPSELLTPNHPLRLVAPLKGAAVAAARRQGALDPHSEIIAFVKPVGAIVVYGLLAWLQMARDTAQNRDLPDFTFSLRNVVYGWRYRV